ncbi:methyltransferase domain-containing protein [Streptomyces sp. 769]|uniref:methyltransferase domain-containing protein n=1 Tax=Streptomyces sp. 769 TaxID=1262452 RepID=UPI00057E814C|nr:methyltransferase domain-containing protein [Streptomyces sp. 769]AJC56966.1 Methyltransferase type 12 [Streptomyces sp. 769]
MREQTGPDGWREANRARWDERVALHTASDYYDQDEFRRTRDVIRDFEAAEVGDVTGRSLLHLQCHFGQDTLSWAYRGAARVVGLDFSEPAIETARDLAAEFGYGPERAAFVAADVYDAAEAVPDAAYDIVYTGIGAVNWLPDLVGWAETVASLVAPGGFLYLAEFHPLADVLDDRTGSQVAHDYFRTEAWDEEAPGSYTDFEARTVHNRSVEWQHSLGDVVSAVVGAGLRVEFLHEHDMTLFQRFGVLRRGEDGYYRFPDDRPRIPLMYSLKASKPA